MGVRGRRPLQAHLRHFPAGEMFSKCGCVGTHPMLGILLANPLGFAGSDCHRAGSFEPITPYPAIVLMILYCGENNGKIKNCHSTGARVAPVSLAVLVFYLPIITENNMTDNMIIKYFRTAYPLSLGV